jgi:predicted Zn-ribbon and HTH transcriptional regulator
MAFNATFINISVISWRLVLLMDPEYPEKITDLSHVPRVTRRVGQELLTLPAHLNLSGFVLLDLCFSV